MKKEEILQALHILAMGRARHPLHEQLAEKLAAVFQTESLPQMADAMREAVAVAGQIDAPKRTRKAKAE
jgi:hypothetical protein